MRPSIVEEICTITAKGQTTVPKAVRNALGVGYGGRIAFRVEDGRVTVHALPTEAERDDPALAPFLAFLAADLAARPLAIQPIEPAFADRVDALAAEIGPIDPEEPIDGDVSL